MEGEVLSRWERFVTDPVFKRYAKYAKEPAALFECIGEDLGGSNQEIREIAFWALVYAMPELTSILHERETREPGWRDREGEDQQKANQGMDIVSYLNHKLVVEHRFKIHGGHGKDPRPLVKRIARNWERDEGRKRSRESPIDYEAVSKIPDPAGSVENSVLANRELDDLEREFLALRFLRGDEERGLFRTIFVDDAPLAEVLKSNSIPTEVAWRKRLSRARKQAVAERDALLTRLLMIKETFPRMGKLPKFPAEDPKILGWCAERAKQSIRPGIWLNGVAADGKNASPARPLTRGLRSAPGHIYLVAIHKGYEKLSRNGLPLRSGELRRVADRLYNFPIGNYASHRFRPDYDLIYPAPYVVRLNPQDDRMYLARLLEASQTELPGLNDALSDVPDDYHVWLISNATLFLELG